MGRREIRVLFARKRPGDLAKDVIALWPGDDWNDFGKKLIFIACFNIEGFQSFETMLKLAFLGESDQPEDVIASKLGENQAAFISKSRLPTFYSLLLSLQGYRDFVAHFGKEATNILALINDLVAVRKTGKPNWYSQALSDTSFATGIIRSNEAFFAFHNAGDVLDGLWSEGSSGLSERLQFRKRIIGYTSEHHFTISFEQDDLVPSRMFVLIGENGVGKTQVLSSVVKALLRPSDVLLDADEAGARPSVARLIALEAPRSGRSPFPAKAPKTSPIFYRRLSLYGAPRGDAFGVVLLKLLRSEQSVAGVRRADLFMSMVSEIAGSGQLHVRCGARPIALDLLLTLGRLSEKSALETYSEISDSSELVWLAKETHTPLSSGQSALVRLAAHLALLIERGTLLVIDEPETHLHPAFIRLFVRLTNDLLVRTGSAAIVATHSAYIVREVSNKQVVILSRGPNGEPDISRPRLRTFGADVGAISFFVFGDEVNAALIDELEGRLPIDLHDREEKISQMKDTISPEAQSQLRRSHEKT